MRIAVYCGDKGLLPLLSGRLPETFDLLEELPTAQNYDLVAVFGPFDSFRAGRLVAHNRLVAFSADEEGLAALLLLLGNPQRRYFSVKTSEGIRKVFHDEVCYISSEGHSLFIVCDHERFVIKRKLSDFARQLGDGFVTCHKSYAVNAARVRQVDFDALLLDNGMQVPMSRANRTQVKAYFQRDKTG